jgi:hypothetical protein
MGAISYWHWLILFLFFLPKVFYLLSVQKTLKLIPEQYRKMNPLLVWLGMIPLFYLLWNFFVVWKTKRSFDALRAAGNTDSNQNGGFAMGIVSSVFAVLIPVLGIVSPVAEEASQFGVMTLVSVVVFFAWIATWIVNWVQVVSSRRAIGR